MVTDKIKFGTDGWRAIIAQDFTVYNVARVAKGQAAWLLKQTDKPVAVVGHDCRFGGKLFSETAAGVLCANGVKVLLAKGFISTPMISLGVLQLKATQGVVITASHNPPTYNGYKLKGAPRRPIEPKRHSSSRSADTRRGGCARTAAKPLGRKRAAGIHKPGGHVCDLPAG